MNKRTRAIDEDTYKLIISAIQNGFTYAGINDQCPIRRNIFKDKYLYKKTGEIKERKKSDNRYQTPKECESKI